MSAFAETALVVVCTGLVLLALVPVLSGLAQAVLAALSVFDTHLHRSQRVLPRTSILIPAWNEAAVIGTTIDRLMKLDYPPDRLRVYVVDDGSSDDTPHIAIAKSKEYPGRVIHIRRVAGGEGKAHTLNYGLEVLWMSDWTEAVLIMDADVIFTPTSVARMARHLADPRVGAVTGNIKEGSRAPNSVQRFITFEYATATGASRRAQNVLGFLACLSGGAQLHSRENLMAIGGKIFDDTLAEDTFTTFKTQLAGRQARFEPNAVVYAEEPDELVGLWKQRIRWARGNVQITSVYRGLWGNKKRHADLGSLAMAVIWFSIFLMPVFQIGASLSLLTLWVIDPAWSWALFRSLWIISGLTYLVVTAGACSVDWESCRKAIVEGITFPGLISLVLIVDSLWPPLLAPFSTALGLDRGWDHDALVLFSYAWLSLSMAVAYGAVRLEKAGRRRAARVALYVGGYGPLLCAVTFGAYLLELKGAEMKWDKTVKTGKVG